MTRNLAFVSIAGLFVAGVLIGGLAALLIAPHVLGPPMRGIDRPPGPPGMRDGPRAHPPLFTDRLERRLQLDDDQRRAIEEIIRDSRRSADEIRDDLRPRLSTVFDRSSERIRELLDPEQQKTFDEMRTRQRRQMERFLSGDPGRHRRPRPRRGDRP